MNAPSPSPRSTPAFALTAEMTLIRAILCALATQFTLEDNIRIGVSGFQNADSLPEVMSFAARILIAILFQNKVGTYMLRKFMN